MLTNSRTGLNRLKPAKLFPNQAYVQKLFVKLPDIHNISGRQYQNEIIDWKKTKEL